MSTKAFAEAVDLPVHRIQLMCTGKNQIEVNGSIAQIYRVEAERAQLKSTVKTVTQIYTLETKGITTHMKLAYADGRLIHTTLL